MLIHDPVQSGGLRWNQSGGLQWNQSGGLQWNQSGGLQWNQSGGISPADSGGLAGPPSLDNTQFFKFYIPVDSGGLQRTQYVTICDKVGVRSSPAESSRVHWSPVESGGTCGGV